MLSRFLCSLIGPCMEHADGFGTWLHASCKMACNDVIAWCKCMPTYVMTMPLLPCKHVGPVACVQNCMHHCTNAACGVEAHVTEQHGCANLHMTGSYNIYLVRAYVQSPVHLDRVSADNLSIKAFGYFQTNGSFANSSGPRDDDHLANCIELGSISVLCFRFMSGRMCKLVQTWGRCS